MINCLLFKLQRSTPHLQCWLKSMQSLLKELLKEPKKLRSKYELTIDPDISHLKHYILLIYTKVIYLYLFHYNTTVFILENPFGVLLCLLQLEKRGSTIFQKIQLMFTDYRKVPVLSGLDKKIKKYLRFDTPSKENILLKENEKKKIRKPSLKDRIKGIIKLNRDKRESFFAVVQKMMSRVKRSVSMFEGEKDFEEAKNPDESDIDRKIVEIKKKLMFGNFGNSMEIDISRRRLEVLKNLKIAQSLEILFLDVLNVIIVGKFFLG